MPVHLIGKNERKILKPMFLDLNIFLLFSSYSLRFFLFKKVLYVKIE